MTAFLETAWSLVEDPEALDKHYRAAAKKNADIELALSRWTWDDADERSEAWLALAETRDLVAPLATSQLFGERVRWAADSLCTFGTARTAALAKEILPKAAGPELKRVLVRVLAELGPETDFPTLHPLLEGHRAMAALARRGDPVGRERLIAAAKTFFDEWREGGRRISSSDWDGPFRLVTSLGQLDHPDAVPMLLEYLVTPCVIHALAGLERAKDARALEPARALLAETTGEQPRCLPYRLGAQAVLHALGEKQGLADAKAVFDCAVPQRYGWPKLEHVYALRAQALRALRTRGAKADVEHVATFATASNDAVRAEGVLAAQQLGRSVTHRFLDAPSLAWLAKHEGLGAVKKCLSEPGAVFKHNAALALSKSKDAAAKKAALAWALGVVEGRHNYPIDELDGAEPDIHAALTILKGFKKVPAVAKTKSSWVRHEVFGEELPEETPPAALGRLHATVERVDQAPFVFGSKLNGLAVDAAGARLAVVMGDGPGCIVDAHSGAVLAHLQPKFRWAFDCAFSPDGKVLAVAYHGGHLVLFDSGTGRLVHEFKGFGGVPRAVKRLSFSSDGRLLAAGGSDGSARLFDVKSKRQLWSVQRPGSFEAVHFSADGSRCVFSHVSLKGGQTNELHVLDVKKKKAKVVKVPSSMWALAFDARGHLFVGGEGKEVVELDAKFKPVRGGKLKQAQVVRLAWAREGQLVAVSQTGEVSLWNVATRKKLKAVVPDAKDKLWALAKSATTLFVGGDQGVVKRFDLDGEPVGVSAGAVHTQQLRGFLTLADGTLITGGWDGQLLRWAPGAPEGALLYAHGSRFNAIALSTDGKRVYCAADAQVVIHDLAAGTQQVVKVKQERVEDVCARNGQVAVAMGGGQVHLFDETTDGLTPRWSCLDAAKEAVSVAITDAGTVLFGTGNGSIGEIGATGTVSWWKREHGLDLIDKDPLGSPHRDVVGLDVSGGRYASLSNDDTLRVFDVASKRRTLRAFVDGGLFNNCVFSPDGRWVAASCSAGLNLFDVGTGERLCELSRSAFPGSTDRTVVAFSGPRQVLLGTENGHIYRVTFS